MASFSKFVRPDAPRPGIFTERDLDIIEAILRYRFSPTSGLTRLVGGYTRRPLLVTRSAPIHNGADPTCPTD